LLLRALGVVHHGHRHEHESDGEQHLVQVAPRVDVDVEGPLQHQAERRGGEEGQRQRGEERHAHAVHQRHGDVAARHGEGPVGEVHQVHQPERDGEAAGQDEQHHAVGDAVEQHGQHGGASSPAERPAGP
jgi:hypothetical protein